MRDTLTQQPLRVELTPGGAFLEVPAAQVERVRQLLKAHNIVAWGTGLVFSEDGGPEIAMVRLGYQADAALLQRLLDEEP